MLSLVLEDIDRRAVNVKGYCTRTRDLAAAGNVPSTTILDVLVRLIQDKAALQAAAGTPGIADFARDQKGDQGLDVVAEFTTMVSAMDGASGWITTNFPKDGSGILLAQTFGATGPIDRQFTPAQTAGFRTQLDAVIATIA
jgi:hypothetical protein